ncbi:unnamed protein product [Chrysoparadoxa australica]
MSGICALRLVQRRIRPRSAICCLRFCSKKAGEGEEGVAWTWSPPLHSRSETEHDDNSDVNDGSNWNIKDGKEWEGEAPSESGEATWTWATPTPTRPADHGGIPIKIGVELTQDEVVQHLTSRGGMDIRVVDLTNKAIDADAMIFVSCQSPLHMKRLSMDISKALKKRKLLDAPSCVGADGKDSEEWMAVDCGNLIVQVMMEDFRREINLEEHWEKSALDVNYCGGDGSDFHDDDDHDHDQEEALDYSSYFEDVKLEGEEGDLSLLQSFSDGSLREPRAAAELEDHCERGTLTPGSPPLWRFPGGAGGYKWSQGDPTLGGLVWRF